jgi:vacuolar-type H+-ATPase subunit E/Vma4
MNRILLGISGFLALLLVIFFLMWRSVSHQNVELQQNIENLTASLNAIQITLQEKQEVITQQDKKYRELLNSIQYNECENLPVSETLLKAAKELQE